ncbi:type I restriction endonuclease subunit R [Desulfonema magnum]|uniref:Type I restriction enzyme endonuclease subunit n=1 Tax=Desulfonema magnum TaxID=45655 RepID=A0A975GK71_9BACT|nr:type I restriction endonuclease subunit R [Desulfonema magnum]QTA84210.1 Site-specific deoxyribonuclease, HsdR family [Desulfonema magnum]
MSNDYTEDKLIQETTINYFRETLGWETEYAYNTEVLGKDGTFGREHEKAVILTRHLRSALETLNPGLPQAAYTEAIETIVSASISKSLIQTNKEKYEYLKNGVPVSLRNDKGETETLKLKLFDFSTPANNHFLAVRELWIQGNPYRRRPDIIGFVNGIPLLFIELKNIHKDINAAYINNLSDYKDTIPHIFHHNALIILSNGDEGKIGSISGKYEHFSQWKRLGEEDKGVVEFETLLKGVCAKENLIDIFENFILFDESSGKTIKIIARNHQFLGVTRAVESLENRKAKHGQLGVFWHTQGSGKSYSMVFFCQKIHRKFKGNYTFVIVTDRRELDTQIYETFAGTGAVTGKHVRASSGEHLEELLTQDHRYIFTLIHKFNQETETPYSERHDIIVISDEAHRSQYGRLALNMRNALPNASFIGFTGTPLFEEDEITRKVFGNYVSTYNFKRATEDGATVPLFYENRGEKLNITDRSINEKIAAKLEEYDLNPDEEARLERDLSREYHIITAEKRLDKIAKDLVEHYTARQDTGKAMVVCIDKLTAVRMHNLIDKYWKARIPKLEKEIQNTTDDQEKSELKKQLERMKETEYAVVISEEQNEVRKFQNWELDIIPHRKKMKERDLDKEFKDNSHPFRLAIVCAMWLTGFDVESLSTLYLDKPLKGHTLMQAIARANRVYEGKNNGLIVDYIGVLKHLRKALAAYAGTRGNEESDPPVRPKQELIQELEEAISETESFLKTSGFDLENLLTSEGFDKIRAIKDAVNAVYTTDETKKQFEILAREVFQKFKAVLPDPVINDFRPRHDAIRIIYKTLQENKENADISDVMKSLHEIIDNAVESETQVSEPTEDFGKIYDISGIDFEQLKQEFSKSERKNTAVHSLKDRIEAKLRKMIAQNPLRIDYYKHYQDIIQEYNCEKDRATIEETFEKLMDFVKNLSEEAARAAKEELNEEQLAIFDLLEKPELSTRDRNKIKKTAVVLLDTLKKDQLGVDNWREKTATAGGVKSYIYDYLFVSLPVESYSDAEVDEKTEFVFNHIYQQYPRYDNNVYARAC